jgi:hypothetical protein
MLSSAAAPQRRFPIAKSIRYGRTAQKDNDHSPLAAGASNGRVRRINRPRWCHTGDDDVMIRLSTGATEPMVEKHADAAEALVRAII